MVPLTSLLTQPNPVFAGGMGIMLVGGVLAYIRRVPSSIIGFVKSRSYFSCEIYDTDLLFSPFMHWLTTNSRRFQSNVVLVDSSWSSMATPQQQNSHPDTSPEDDQLRVSMLPGEGTHLATYNGVRFLVRVGIKRSELSPTVLMRHVSIKGRIRHREALLQLFKELAKALEQRPIGKVLICYASRNGWERRTTISARPVDSVVLAEGVWNRVLSPLKAFTEARDRYTHLGIPYRTGLLLSGPPGNGKSTLALALAGALRRNLYLLPLGDSGMSDTMLGELMADVPQHAVVVVEDIDAIFEGRTRMSENKLTLSGLLNSIDGVGASEGRILIFTTNRPEVLDPALIRPGRCDFHVVLENANADQARQIFCRFFPGADPSDFATWAGDGTWSMAALQAHLMANQTDAGAASQHPGSPLPTLTT